VFHMVLRAGTDGGPCGFSHGPRSWHRQIWHPLALSVFRRGDYLDFRGASSPAIPALYIWKAAFRSWADECNLATDSRARHAPSHVNERG
jgi:hypothetical protein